MVSQEHQGVPADMEMGQAVGETKAVGEAKSEKTTSTGSTPLGPAV
jgi:hypothetical protein